MMDKPYTISTADFVGPVEITGWVNPHSPEPLRLAHLTVSPFQAVIERRKLQEHLAAVLEQDPYDDYYGICAWCGGRSGDAHHDGECPWALARAYLDSLNAE